MNFFFFIPVLLLSSIKMYATVQNPDLLIIGNDTVELHEMNIFPLEYLHLKARPFNHTRETAPSTACWRGYQAIWRIIDNEIYLVKIQRCYVDNHSDRFEPSLPDLFKRNGVSVIEKNGMIFAVWINAEFYELDGRHSNIKGKRRALTDNKPRKIAPKKSDSVLVIKNGRIESNTSGENSR